MTVFDIYTRKSTLDTGRSLVGQEEECREDLLAEGHTPGRLFADPELSASRYATKARPDYQALLDHMRSGDCEGLALWESSRGSRNLAEWVALLDLCRQRNIPIRVQSHRRTYDIRRRRDWRTLAEDGIDAADESERISERSRRGVRSRAMAGLPSGKLLYGYRRVYDERGRYVEQVEHEAHAPIVRQIVATILARGKDGAVAAIARDLNRRGVATPTGTGKWYGATVSKLAVNPAYVAKRVHRGVVVGEGKWPKILDDDDYDAVVALLRDPDRRTQQGTLLRWELSGALTCGECSAAMRPHRAVSRGVAYQTYGCRQCCRVHVGALHVERLVASMVRGRLRAMDQAALFAAPVTDIQIAAARREVSTLKARLKEHARKSAHGLISPDLLATVEAELVPLIEKAEATVRSLSRPRALREFDGMDVAADWDKFTAAQRRTVIRALCGLRVDRGVRGRPTFDRARLGRSRWHGDDRTWADYWSEEG